MADESQGAPIEQAPVLDLTFLLGHNSDGRFGRTPIGTFASGAQGAKADSAVQPTRELLAGTGLTGGGDLSEDRTIALDAASIASLALADSSLFRVASLSAAPTASIPASVTSVFLELEGDQYSVVGSEPNDSFKFENADRWFAIQSPFIYPRSADAAPRPVSATGTLPNSVWQAKFHGQFPVIEYLRSVDIASAQAVEAYDIASQNGDNVLAAVRAAGDDMLAFVQAANGRAGNLILPDGDIGMKDEFFSDTFQQAVWLNTNLGSSKRFEIAGSGVTNSQISVRSDYISGVRNTANGNQRTYGPWAGSASPSILFPMIGGVSNPVAFMLRDFVMMGSNQFGIDPIAWVSLGELGGLHQNVTIQSFGNSAQLVHGTFNSTYDRIHAISNGFQSTSVGARLGAVPGISPTWVGFDVTAATGTIVAKAIQAMNGFNIGDPVPFFTAGDVGVTVVVQAILNVGSGVLQPLKTTVATFIDPTSVTIVIPSGFVINDVTATNMSFMPVRATTTANSTSISLNAPILWGRGSRDMIGQIVTVPKAGSKVQTDRDLFVTRIVGLSGGDDTAGYTSVTVANQPRFSVTEDFIVTAGYHSSMDETAMVNHPISRMDGTSTSRSRWENGSTGSYQGVIGTCNSAVQFFMDKWHGTTGGNNFAGEGQMIIDNAIAADFAGCAVTHMGVHSDGCVRMTGFSGNISLTDIELGGFRIAQDFKGLFFSPMTGFVIDNWGVAQKGLTVDNTAFRNLNQLLISGDASLNGYTLSLLMITNKQRNDRQNELGAADDLNNVFLQGVYSWGSTDVPANVPPFGARSSVIVTNFRTETSQFLLDRDNHNIWARDFTGTWSGWRPLQGMQTGVTADFATATSAINTVNKIVGTAALNTTTGSLYISTGTVATSPWWVFNKDSTVTPV